MHSTARFRIRLPKVAFEVIDREVLVINMETGHYYSLTDVSADIWTAIDAGLTVGETIIRVTDHRDGDGSEIEAAVRDFLGQLEREALIEADGASCSAGAERTGASSESPLQAGPGPDDPRPPFVAPRLEKYIDMEKLLLLDPVHEVDETGWPHTTSRP